MDNPVHLQSETKDSNTLILERELFCFIAYGDFALVLGSALGYAVYTHEKRKYVSAGSNKTDLSEALSEKHINYILIEKGRITEQARYADNQFMHYLSSADRTAVLNRKPITTGAKIAKSHVVMYNKQGESIQVCEAIEDPGFIYAVYKGKTYRESLEAIGSKLFFAPLPGTCKALNKQIQSKSQNSKPVQPLQHSQKAATDKRTASKPVPKTSASSVAQGYYEPQQNFGYPYRPRERKNLYKPKYDENGLDELGRDRDGYDPNSGHSKYWKGNDLGEQQ